MMSSRKREHSFHESSTDFTEKATSSNLVHLTKDRPKSLKRKNSSRTANRRAAAVNRSKSDAGVITDSLAPKRLPNKVLASPKKTLVKPNKESSTPSKLPEKSNEAASNVFEKSVKSPQRAGPKPGSPRKQIKDNPFFRADSQERRESPIKKTLKDETPKSPVSPAPSSPRKTIRDSPFFKTNQEDEQQRISLKQTSNEAPLIAPGTPKDILPKRKPSTPRKSSKGEVPKPLQGESKTTFPRQSSNKEDEPTSTVKPPPGESKTTFPRQSSNKEDEPTSTVKPPPGKSKSTFPRQSSNQEDEPKRLLSRETCKHQVQKPPVTPEQTKPAFPRKSSEEESQNAQKSKQPISNPHPSNEKASSKSPISPTRQTDSQERSTMKVNNGNPFAVNLKPVPGRKGTAKNVQKDSVKRPSTQILPKQNSLNEASNINSKDTVNQVASRSKTESSSMPKSQWFRDVPKPSTKARDISKETSDSVFPVSLKPVSPRRKTVREEPSNHSTKTPTSNNSHAKEDYTKKKVNEKKASSPPSIRPTRKVYRDNPDGKLTQTKKTVSKQTSQDKEIESTLLSGNHIESTKKPVSPKKITKDNQDKPSKPNSPKVNQNVSTFPVSFTPEPPRKIYDKPKESPKPTQESKEIPSTSECPESKTKQVIREPQPLLSPTPNKDISKEDTKPKANPNFPVTFTPDQPRKIYKDNPKDIFTPEQAMSTLPPTTEISNDLTDQPPMTKPLPRKMSRENDPFDGITLRSSSSSATIDFEDDKEPLIPIDSNTSSSTGYGNNNHQDISVIGSSNNATEASSPSLDDYPSESILQKDEQIKTVASPVSSKPKGIVKGSFRLPGLDELRGKTLRKTKKYPDHNVSLIHHEVTDDATYEEENGFPKRGGSLRAKGSSPQTKNHQEQEHKPIKRSFSTGQTFREKLESGGNSLRTGISRIGSSVTSRTQPRLTNKVSAEEKQVLISEDPDENTDFLVKMRDEERAKERETELASQCEPPKDKRRLIGGQSAKITIPKSQQPSVPSYKKLGDDCNPSQSSSPSFDEPPTEVYKPLSTSPKLGLKKPNEDENRAKNELNAKKNEWNTESKISWERQKLLENEQQYKVSESYSNQGLSSYYPEHNNGNNGIYDSQNMTNDENSTNTIKHMKQQAVDNLQQPQRSDNDNPVISQDSSNVTKYGSGGAKYGQGDPPLKRSLTWNSFKSPFGKRGESLKKTNRREAVEEDRVIENQNTANNNKEKKGGSYTPLAIRRAFSIKTFTPKLGRRRVDENGRILDDKGCAKRNILSSLFSSTKSLNKQSTNDLLDSSSDDDMQTSLYENNFKKTNAKNASKNSWLGKSGLLDESDDPPPSSPNTFKPPSPQLSEDLQRLNGTTSKPVPSGGQGATGTTAKPKGERQHLLQEDSDSDEDLCLDRSIRSKSANKKDAKDNRDKGSKRFIMSGGLPSFRKKYSFDKL